MRIEKYLYKAYIEKYCVTFKNVFTVTLNQFRSSLLNKIRKFLKKKKTIKKNYYCFLFWSDSVYMNITWQLAD